MDRQDTAKISFDVESRFRDYFKYLTTVVKGRDIANAIRLSLGVQILNSATEVYIRIKRANRKKSIGDKIRLANEADELWDDTKALMKLFCECERRNLTVRKEANLVSVAEKDFGMCFGGWLKHIRNMGFRQGGSNIKPPQA